MAPSDPILGVTEAYVADQTPRKVNLGVGVYYDDNGKVPLLECVRHAESERLKSAAPRGYLPIDGIAAYDKAVQELVFGKGAPILTERRVLTRPAAVRARRLHVCAAVLTLIYPGAPRLVIET